MHSPGTQLGGYRIEGLLGRGGMGVVYEATQLSLNRLVALKLLSSELGADPSFRARFQREGRLHATIDHAHIVPIYDSGELDDEGLYIAMRLVRGPNLKELVLSGELEPQRALRLLGPVADALDSAHEANLVHRDIKPQNILVGPRDHGYLADFGLTRAPGETAFTKTGQFVGTLDYIAPEQILGEDAGSGSDVYSFAAVVYECLTRSVPYPRPTEAAVLFAHVSDPPPRASARVEALEPVDEILARAMAKDPAERPPSAVSFIQELAVALPETLTPPASVARTVPAAPPLPPVPAARVGERLGEATIPPHATGAEQEAAPAEPPPWPAPRLAPDPEPEPLPEPEPVLAGVGERTEQRSRRGASTVADRRRPWPVAPVEAPAPATIRLNKRLVAAALGLLVVFTAIGVVAGGGRDDTSSAVAAGAAFRAGAIVMRVPAGWSSRRDASALPGLQLTSGRAFAAPAGSAPSLIAGTTHGGGAALLPASFERTLPGTPKGVPVKMGGLEALRYSALRPRGATRTMTVFVAPTTQGVATVVCSGSAEQRRVCEAAATTVRTASGVDGYPLTARADYAKAADRILDRLADDRRAARARWRARKTRTGQARESARLATRYAAAARNFAALPAGPRERIVQKRIVSKLRAVAARLREMQQAAGGGRERAYAQARMSERRSQAELRAAVRELDRVGYRLG